MIKNTYLFAISLLLFAVGAVLRHQGFPDTENATLLTDFRIWISVGGIFFIASLFSFKRRTPVAQTPFRGEFKKETLPSISRKINSYTQEERPDIPLIVDYIVFQAIEKGSSDIHFDPGYNGMTIKFRVDSMMLPVATVQKELTPSIINRLKVLSNLIIYKDAVPQDGRLNGVGTSEYSRRELLRSGLSNSDFRIAFMPTLHGERIVIRILAKGGATFNLSDLGMDTGELEVMSRLIEQPQGMIILTGPTGSGKSTTIYAALHEIVIQSECNRSIATLEDPIEYDLDGINQSQVDEAKNFTFAKGLRAILRQDPDVIMLGEIRDTETAQIAVQAGMTGHLVISTVHAGSTVAVFSRLNEMGIPSYSINSSITAILAQRLIRKICPHCSKERNWTDVDLRVLQMDTTPTDFPLHVGTGCPNCKESGYLGRIAIYEILEVTESIRRMVTEQVDTEHIYQHAKNQGMRSLWETGLEAIKKGLTTPEEVSRVVSRELR